MEEEKVEVEEYISDGEVQIRWANGVLIFCTAKGKEILENCLKP